MWLTYKHCGDASTPTAVGAVGYNDWIANSTTLQAEYVIDDDECSGENNVKLL